MAVFWSGRRDLHVSCVSDRHLASPKVSKRQVQAREKRDGRAGVEKAGR